MIIDVLKPVVFSEVLSDIQGEYNFLLNISTTDTTQIIDWMEKRKFATDLLLNVLSSLESY